MGTGCPGTPGTHKLTLIHSHLVLLIKHARNDEMGTPSMAHQTRIYLYMALTGTGIHSYVTRDQIAVLPLPLLSDDSGNSVKSPDMASVNEIKVGVSGTDCTSKLSSSEGAVDVCTSSIWIRTIFRPSSLSAALVRSQSSWIRMKQSPTDC